MEKKIADTIIIKVGHGIRAIDRTRPPGQETVGSRESRVPREGGSENR